MTRPLRTSLPRLLRAWALAVCGAGTLAHAAPPPGGAWQRVDLPLATGETLQAYWWPADGTAAGPQRRPAVVALHGCGGLHARNGRLAPRYRETAEDLHAAGHAVLLPDSFGSRGVSSICGTPYRDRDAALDVVQRVQDARAAIAWAAAQPGVDAQRIGVLGWSNGATTALHLLEQRRLHPQAGEVPLAGVALFYPGCGPLLRRQAALEPAPLLMQLGASDDWTPAQPCVDLARELQARPGADVTLHVYPDSHHGFDSAAPVRLRTDVPNGMSAQGVHQGGNPAARALALAALRDFWTRVLATRAAP